jgi:hypothetical protein
MGKVISKAIYGDTDSNQTIQQNPQDKKAPQTQEEINPSPKPAKINTAV